MEASASDVSQRISDLEQTLSRLQKDRRLESYGVASRLKTLENAAGFDPRDVHGAGLNVSLWPAEHGGHRGPGTVPASPRRHKGHFDFEALEHRETQTGTSLSMTAAASTVPSAPPPSQP